MGWSGDWLGFGRPLAERHRAWFLLLLLARLNPELLRLRDAAEAGRAEAL
jgi:hypothetical protein